MIHRSGEVFCDTLQKVAHRSLDELYKILKDLFTHCTFIEYHKIQVKFEFQFGLIIYKVRTIFDCFYPKKIFCNMAKYYIKSHQMSYFSKFHWHVGFVTSWYGKWELGSLKIKKSQNIVPQVQ